MLVPTKVDENYDLREVERMLDKAKTRLFIGKSSAFFGSLLCTTPWIWAGNIPTACTDGHTIFANPVWYAKQTVQTQQATIRHELEHIARLHIPRKGTRDAEIWNFACDYRINNDMESDGVVFKDFKPYIDRVRFPWDMCEEDIYRELLKDPENIPQLQWGNGESDGGDMIEPASDDKLNDALKRVITARTQAVMAGQAGSLPGYLEQTISQFLDVQVPWQDVLQRFLQEKVRRGRSWARPNRRYRDDYLPGRGEDDGALAHIQFYMDVSGSVGEKEIIQFSSEFKYVKDIFRPDKITLVQFDTEIKCSKTWEQQDEVDDLEIIGGGGTSLIPVHQHITETQPTVAIIFSDLECKAMEHLKSPIPVLWIVVNNPRKIVRFGDRVDIRT